MKYNVGNDIAKKMDEIFKSAEHQALFGKTAQYVQRHNEVDPSSQCDGVLARGECLKCHKTVEVAKADDSCAKETSDCSMVDDSSTSQSYDSKESTAYDIALDSLLTASAALDSVGFAKSAAISLKIASLVAEAAKKKEKAKGKKDEKSTSKSKKEDSKSKSKKEDSKSKSSKSKEDSKSKSVKKKSKNC